MPGGVVKAHAGLLNISDVALPTEPDGELL